jgi:hypothetical protein
MMPLHDTEAGTALGVQNQLPLENVQPSFNLPEDGARPEDKQEEESARRATGEAGASDEEQDVDALPEIFRLVMAKDFRELFLLYLGEDQGEMLSLHRTWRTHLGSNRKQPVSNWYAKGEQAQEKRSDSYDSSLFYHYTKPGNRFTGAM